MLLAYSGVQSRKLKQMLKGLKKMFKDGQVGIPLNYMMLGLMLFGSMDLHATDLWCRLLVDYLATDFFFAWYRAATRYFLCFIALPSANETPLGQIQHQQSLKILKKPTDRNFGLMLERPDCNKPNQPVEWCYSCPHSQNCYSEINSNFIVFLQDLALNDSLLMRMQHALFNCDKVFSKQQKINLLKDTRIRQRWCW